MINSTNDYCQHSCTVHQLAASQRETIVIVTDVYFAEPTEFESGALVLAPAIAAGAAAAASSRSTLRFVPVGLPSVEHSAPPALHAPRGRLCPSARHAPVSQKDQAAGAAGAAAAAGSVAVEVLWLSPVVWLSLA
jgi:hypothetical protein